MRLLTFEHSPAAYRADFALSGLAIVALATSLLVAGPRLLALELAGTVLAGIAGWTLVEYLLHRFVLHGVQPFRRWHALHHERPTALIYTPTVLVAALVLAWVFAPMWWLGGVWRATALTLGVLLGNFAYAAMHHLVHHGHRQMAWLMQRRRWHALHHRRQGPGVCYGVTSPLWDHVFGSTPQADAARADAAA